MIRDYSYGFQLLYRLPVYRVLPGAVRTERLNFLALNKSSGQEINVRYRDACEDGGGTPARPELQAHDQP